MRPWLAVELSALADLYPRHTNATLAATFGRTESAINARAAKSGLVKSAEFKRDCGLRSGYRRGDVPWNKGLAFDSGGRSAETRFKPGRPAREARNYLPLGSLRLSKEGHLERKTTDDPAIAPARRWVGVHRLAWQEAHGPVPAGHAVAFKSGRRTTDADAITADAVELVSRAELMRRNSVHNYPPEIARLVQLRGALNRQINKRQTRA